MARLQISPRQIRPLPIAAHRSRKNRFPWRPELMAVIPADQLFTGVLRDLAELVVDRRDDAGAVGGGDDGRLVQRELHVGELLEQPALIFGPFACRRRRHEPAAGNGTSFDGTQGGLMLAERRVDGNGPHGGRACGAGAAATPATPADPGRRDRNGRNAEGDHSDR